MLGCVPTLILMQGGDALSACFNVINVLFLSEIDNVAFWLGIDERDRSRVEAEARVELDDTQAAAMKRTKLVHISLVLVIFPLTVALGFTSWVVHQLHYGGFLTIGEGGILAMLSC